MRSRCAAIGRVIIGIRIIGVTPVTAGIRGIRITCVTTGIIAGIAIRIWRGVAAFPVVPMPLNHRAGLYEWPVAARIAARAAAARAAATMVISAIATRPGRLFIIRIKIGTLCR
jgi:hypothetical protein